jgi:hypothetical protein
MAGGMGSSDRPTNWGLIVSNSRSDQDNSLQGWRVIALDPRVPCPLVVAALARISERQRITRR